jgi:hypothetical protein
MSPGSGRGVSVSQEVRPRMASTCYVADCPVGRGVFAARVIEPGETILRFHGPRVDRNDPIHFTDVAANLLQTGRTTYILPAAPGVLVNHSCNPNAGLVGNRRLVALRRIARDEEIRFDYSTTMDDGLWTLDCLCGDPACRRVVTDFHLLPDAVRDLYLQAGVVQGFIARRYREDAPPPAMAQAG